MFVRADGIWEARFGSVGDLRTPTAGVVTPYTVYRRGVPATEVRWLECLHGACTVYWRAGRLLMTVSYRLADGDENRSEIWESPSGLGGDWVEMSTIAAPTFGAGLILFGSEFRSAGVPTDDWWLSASKWTPEGNKRQAVYRSSDGGSTWAEDLDVGYYALGGIYGEGQTSHIINLGGTWWSSQGNPGPDQAAYNDGSWTVYTDYPTSTLLGRQYLGDDGVFAYRIRREAPGDVSWRIERSAAPMAGPWEVVVGELHGGNISDSAFGHLVGAYLDNAVKWLEYEPGGWALFAHDKVWFPWGGWTVGHLGSFW